MKYIFIVQHMFNMCGKIGCVYLPLWPAATPGQSSSSWPFGQFLHVYVQYTYHSDPRQTQDNPPRLDRSDSSYVCMSSILTTLTRGYSRTVLLVLTVRAVLTYVCPVYLPLWPAANPGQSSSSWPFGQFLHVYVQYTYHSDPRLPPDNPPRLDRSGSSYMCMSSILTTLTRGKPRTVLLVLTVRAVLTCVCPVYLPLWPAATPGQSSSSWPFGQFLHVYVQYTYHSDPRQTQDNPPRLDRSDSSYMCMSSILTTLTRGKPRTVLLVLTVRTVLTYVCPVYLPLWPAATPGQSSSSWPFGQFLHMYVQYTYHSDPRLPPDSPPRLDRLDSSYICMSSTQPISPHM